MRTILIIAAVAGAGFGCLVIVNVLSWRQLTSELVLPPPATTLWLHASKCRWRLRYSPAGTDAPIDWVAPVSNGDQTNALTRASTRRRSR